MAGWDAHDTIQDAWERDRLHGDFEPAYESFYEQSLQPFERDFYLRHRVDAPLMTVPKPPETHTAKEWQRIRGQLVVCKHCGEEGYGLSCAFCGLPRKGVA